MVDRFDKIMEEIIEIIDQIEEQVNTCCAVTMYPEDVVDLIDKLKEKLKEYEDRNNSR
jgi:non-homologous end joining protein Ku